MRAGNLIVFGPGFRQVWKFKFDAIPLLVLVVVFYAFVMWTAGYIAPLMASGDTENSSRLVVENGTLSIENRAAQLQLQQLAERARKLEEESSRIAAEMDE
jgi:siroheme synthase